MSYQVPLVLAGTAEGTVFAFALSDPPKDGCPQDVTGGGKGFSIMSGVGVGKAGLGRVLMKFEHTRRCIDSISCSRYQVGLILMPVGLPFWDGGFYAVSSRPLFGRTVRLRLA